MKQEIKELIQQAITKLYPNIEVVFSVDYASANVDADLASNAAMILAKKLGKKPMEAAEEIASALPRNDKFSVAIARPGFLNFKLPDTHWQHELENILKQGEKYGSSDIGKGKRVNVESVSANPTGPLTVGHGRGAMIGFVLSNILKSQGYEVVRDYYYNDGGVQMKKLGQSVMLRAKEEFGDKMEFPEGLYEGAYIRDLAKKFIKEKGLQKPNENWEDYWQFAADEIFLEIKATLEKLGIRFDNFFNELSLFDKQKKGNIWELLAELERKGVVREKDGAKWLVTDDQEKVVVRSTGEPTYRLPDIAYHVYKLGQGYERIINILGADHIGQFPDIKYAVGKLGFDPEKIQVIINQFVTLAGGPSTGLRASKKMSTRKAQYVTLDELIDEAGVQATKFFMLMNAPSTHMVFDLALAKDTSEKNPVYKVQYAHARIQSILAKSQIPSTKSQTNSKFEILNSNEELSLIRELSKFPELILEISETYNVHHLPHYLLGLADKFHGFYERVRVITDDQKETAARLALVSAVQIVVANGLRLMGIEPAEKM